MRIRVSMCGFLGTQTFTLLTASLGRAGTWPLHFVRCISFLWCYNKLPCTGWLKATETYSLTVLVARSSKSRCGQGHCSPRAPGRILPRLSRLPVAPAIPWLVSASFQSLPTSSYHLFCICVSTRVFVSQEDIDHWI